MDLKHKVATSDFLHKMVNKSQSDRVTIDEIKIALHERGFGLLMTIFALPLSIPIPYIPGLTTFLALPLLFLSVQMLFGFDYPWLPKWLGNRSIKRSSLASIILKSSPYLKKIEKLLRPRLTIIICKTGDKIIGLFCIIFALSIALPLPFTNLLPAIGILIMSLGLLSKDGLTILIGALIGTIGVILTIAVFILGKKIVMGLIGSIF